MLQVQNNLSLADNAWRQIKTFINVSTSNTNNVVITPTNLRNNTTITLNAEMEKLLVCSKMRSKCMTK